MTPRVAECYDMMKCGLTTAEIAVVMNIKIGGARSLRHAANRHLGIAERDRLAALASRRYERGQVSFPASPKQNGAKG